MIVCLKPSEKFLFLSIWKLFNRIYFFFQDPNPALRLKDDIIAETGLGVGPVETNGSLKRRESPDFDDNHDISGIEDEDIGGGGLRRDISIDNLHNDIITTKSSSNEVDWKVMPFEFMYIIFGLILFLCSWKLLLERMLTFL